MTAPFTATDDPGALPDCRFCGHLRDQSPARNGEWSILAETEHLVAVPSVGPLVPGWLLVVPKNHILSFGSAMPDTIATLAAETESIAERWQRLFGPLVWFEHGPARTRSSVGCGIDHAHLHLVPVAGEELLDGARTMFPSLDFRGVTGIAAAAAPVAHDQSYLYMRAEDGSSWLATSHEIPSQAFRRVIAHQQGRPLQYDWKAFPQHDALGATLKSARHSVLSGISRAR